MRSSWGNIPFYMFIREHEDIASGGIRLARVAEKFFAMCFSSAKFFAAPLYSFWRLEEVLQFKNISHFCLNLSHWRRASWILSETLLRAGAYLLSSPLSSPAFRERPSPSYSTTTVTFLSIIRRCCPPPSPAQPNTSPASRSTMWMVSSQQAPLRVSGTVFVISPLIYSRLFY